MAQSNNTCKKSGLTQQISNSNSRQSRRTEKINNNRDNRIKQQRDEKATGKFSPDYMPIRITSRDASAATAAAAVAAAAAVLCDPWRMYFCGV